MLYSISTVSDCVPVRILLRALPSIQLPCMLHIHTHHSCWRASFLAFCLGGRPAICTIYIPDISFIYPMCIYNYLHLWRAARNVKNPPASNYAAHCGKRLCSPQLHVLDDDVKECALQHLVRDKLDPDVPGGFLKIVVREEVIGHAVPDAHHSNVAIERCLLRGWGSQRLDGTIGLTAPRQRSS